MQTVAILASSNSGVLLARCLKQQLETAAGFKVGIFSSRKAEGATKVTGVVEYTRDNFNRYDAFIFIGALGICVRAIAPVIQDKYSDPAVVNCDERGVFVQPVLSGHVGGGNELAGLVARLIGARPVITTSSDVQGLWSLDILGREQGWTMEFVPGKTQQSLAGAISIFVNHEPTVLLLETRDEQTDYLEQSKAHFVSIVYDYEEIDFTACSLLLAVTPRIFSAPVPSFFYRPKVLCAGLGCEKNIDPEAFVASFIEEMGKQGLSPLSLKALGTVDFKTQEKAFRLASEKLGIPLHGFTAKLLESVEGVPNPSETVYRKVGVHSVAEASTALLAGESKWVVEKEKVALPGFAGDNPRHYTVAVSMDRAAVRRGRIAIVGAGPGDPELVTVKGKHYLETADLILYAGSLVPEKLTHYAKPGAGVRSSASMTLEEQFLLIDEFYRQGKCIVRLHTGDPSIYGAVHEQMTYFESNGMDYCVVPGVSSFQAAAAVLKSQFTVPEKVQTVILTRFNGRTPVPEKEALCELARSQATICLYLSAEWAKEVQEELLCHYDPSTPVAVCYRLTWDDEQIWRGALAELAALVKQSGKTRTILIVVGESVGARGSRSKLYDPSFSHGFRHVSSTHEGNEL